jgi:hypothetical protein
LFPNTFCNKGKERARPRSIDDALPGLTEGFDDQEVVRSHDVIPSQRALQIKAAQDGKKPDDADDEGRRKRRRLDEVWRYDVDRGGAVGVGMGVMEDADRVIIDDLDSK